MCTYFTRHWLMWCVQITVNVYPFLLIQFLLATELLKTWYTCLPIFTRVNQKVKTIFKLCGNQETKELAHCAVLTMPVEEFSHVQYNTLPSVKWQQQGRKHGHSFARLHHRRTMWRSVVSLGRRSETCGNSPSYVGSVWTEHHESMKDLRVGGKV